ncbi:MAG TPA: hypothetical protein VGN01_19580 [Acidobacteriaceae bacterium]
MKHLLVVALIVAGAALPACAQRGGSHGGSGGHSGGGFASHGGGMASHGPAPTSRGFTSHGAPPSRGFSSVGRMPAHASPQLRYGVSREVGREAFRRPADNDSHRRFGHSVVDRFPRPYRPIYGGGFVTYSPFLDLGYPGYYADTPAYDSAAPSYSAAPEQPAAYPDDQSPAPPTEEAQDAAPFAYRPPYVHPLPEPNLGVEAAVTLIYKDGRPSEQIQNYMLTRSTLYVQEQRLREIPVADLDLPATEKINKAAGVDFQLPGTLR